MVGTSVALKIGIVLGGSSGSLSSTVVAITLRVVLTGGFTLVDLSLSSALGLILKVGGLELLIVIESLVVISVVFEGLVVVGLSDLTILGGLTREESLVEGSGTVDGVEGTKAVTTGGASELVEGSGVLLSTVTGLSGDGGNSERNS